MISQKLIVLVGPPASGKSTFVKKYMSEHPYTSLLSSDKLRGVFGKDENDQSVSAKVFQYMENEVENTIKAGNDVLIDATNMHLKARKVWVDIARKYNTNLVAYVFNVSREELIKRNQERGKTGGRNVPVDVIDRMLNSYVDPCSQEGFNKVYYV